MNILRRIREIDRDLERGLISYQEAADVVAPFTDAEPVKHGHWEWAIDDLDDGYGNRNLPHCSVCGRAEPLAAKRNYCGSCGAKMDLKVHYCDRNKCLQMEYAGKGCAECEAEEWD